MYQLIVLLVIATIALASSFPGSGRVVNGIDAKQGEIPYIVSLRSYTFHSCGGSILDRYHILTAAHCVQNSSPDTLTIQYGVLETSKDDNVIQVEKVIVHEDYRPWDSNANDIAILKLASPLPEYNENIQPVVLPQQDEAPPAGDTSILAGWGYSSPGSGIMKHLQRVDLLVYSDEDCSEAHGSSVNSKYHLCSGVPEGGKGQCTGDSGGPLVARGKQIGCVSWSVKPCTVKGYPGVYCRVASFVDWINKHTK